MKYAALAWLLIGYASTTTACDLMGVKGQISADGQSIIGRQLVALKEQANLYGGYQGAANYVEQNRQSAMRSDKLSLAVKSQVNKDLRANVEQLKCWASACSNDSTNLACRF